MSQPTSHSPGSTWRLGNNRGPRGGDECPHLEEATTAGLRTPDRSGRRGRRVDPRSLARGGPWTAEKRKAETLHPATAIGRRAKVVRRNPSNRPFELSVSPPGLPFLLLPQVARGSHRSSTPTLDRSEIGRDGHQKKTGVLLDQGGGDRPTGKALPGLQHEVHLTPRDECHGGSAGRQVASNQIGPMGWSCRPRRCSPPR
jgi:hypothetical protein